MFTGEPTLARGVAAEETTVLAVPPDALRALVAGSAELGISSCAPWSPVVSGCEARAWATNG